MALIVTLSVDHFVTLSSLRAADDESILHDAELSSDGPTLVAFFQARARLDVDGKRLRQLLTQFANEDKAVRAAATTELLGLGSLALQALRQSANDLDRPEVAIRAARCLPWLEGPASHQLLIAAAHLLAQRKPDGAAAALLAYLPFADNPDVIREVNTALAAVAAPKGKPDGALLRGLSDRMGMRRAAAGVALCSAVSPEQVPDVRKLLHDPAPAVRLRAARALAEANDAEAIPVLIDLLAELPAGERQGIEDLLKELAGEWALTLQIPTDDEVSRRVRRDAWASWWRHTDDAMLLAAIAKHTLSAEKSRQIQELLKQLGSDAFKVREDASRQLLAFGRLALPRLHEAIKDRDVEVARRAKALIERIENGPDRRLPVAVLRLLAVRKPAGSVEALLAYLPFVEDEVREEQVRKALVVLARREGKIDAALRRALADSQAKVRAVAAEVLIEGGGGEGRAAVRKLLAEDVPSVRLRAALALARAGESEGVSLLIDLLPSLPAQECAQAEEALYQLAGDTVPKLPDGAESDDSKKRRDAWSAWWKINAKHVDTNRLRTPSSLGYTVICDYGTNRVFEIDRMGKERWSIGNIPNPIDAVVLPGQRVLIAEFQGNRVTERDFKGNILWQMAIASPVNVQRLPNGNTFIASNGGLIMEVDRAGKAIYSINNVPGNVLTAYRWPQGDIVCLTADGRCRILDTSRKQLKEFVAGHDAGGSCILDLRPNGRILVSRRKEGKVVEFDRDGQTVREFNAPGVSIASHLPNGNILAASESNHCVYELDRAGKIVWEYKGPAGNGFLRVRRR